MVVYPNMYKVHALEPSRMMVLATQPYIELFEAPCKKRPPVRSGMTELRRFELWGHSCITQSVQVPIYQILRPQSTHIESPLKPKYII